MKRLVAVCMACTLSVGTSEAQTCKGETFDDNFSNLNNWSVGGGGSLGSGNGGESSYQGSAPGQNITSGSNGLTMSVLQGAANPSGAPYTGAMMSTQNAFSQTYGYFETTMTIPQSMLSSGMTSAFWLLGYQWPPEIDIEESQASAMSSGVHASTQGETGTYYNYNFSPGTHTFAVDWTPQTITFYESGPDGQMKQTTQVPTPSNFNQPMYMVLDAMAGPQGGYLGNPSGSSSVTVQQVRVFDNMADAQACGSQVNALATAQPTTHPFTAAQTAELDQLQKEATQQEAELTQLQSEVSQQQSTQNAKMPNGYDPCSPDPSLGDDMAAKAASICSQIQQANQDMATAQVLLQQTISRQGQQ